jgi:tryptophan synthase alpha chain
VAAVSDAVVIGSALVARLEALQGERERAEREVSSFVADLRAAIDWVRPAAV